MKILIATNSLLPILVSDEDYVSLLISNWHINKTDGYARENTNIFGHSKCLHVIIAERMGLNINNEIDHKDRNRINDQRYNLRLSTRQQNSMNCSIRNGKQYKGVNYIKARHKYRARIMFNGEAIYLGYFHSEKDAALVYNQAALKYFGEFAVLNEIE